MKLVLFSDFHYISDYYKHPDLEYHEYSKDFVKEKNEFYKFAINSIFDEEADYYISLGDLTNFGTYDENNEIYKLIDQTDKEEKFINVLGNHDLYTYSADDLMSMIVKDYNYMLDFDQVRLLFIKSALDKNYEDFGGFLDDITLNWLKKEFEKDDKLTLMFSHHPIYDTVTKSSEEYHYIRPVEDVDKIIQGKNKGQVIFFSGHNHFDSIIEKDNWIYVGLGSFLDKPRYCVVEIDDVNLEIKSKEIDLPKKIEKTRINIGENMPYFSLIPEGVGNKEDREISIKL